MRNQIFGIVRKYLGKSPASLGFDGKDCRKDMTNSMVDDLMLLGLLDGKDDMPLKIPLEAIIQLQEDEIEKLELKVIELGNTLESKEDSFNEHLKLSSQELENLKKEKHYGGMVAEKRHLEKIIKTMRVEKKHYFDKMLEYQAKLLKNQERGEDVFTIPITKLKNENKIENTCGSE